MFFICDDAKSWAKTVKKVFDHAIMIQDLKHLINRCIEVVGTTKDGAPEFASAFHNAFTTEDEMPVISRTGSVHKVKVPLDSPERIIERVESVIRNYQRVYPNLISDEFLNVWRNQIQQIHDYVKDPIVDGNNN